MIRLSFILFLQSPVSLYFMFSCLIVATLSYYLCCDFSWFVKLFKLMESYYSVVIFFFIYGLFFLFFPLLYFLMVSSLFFMISHLWMWWVLTRWFNYRIVIRKVNSTHSQMMGILPNSHESSLWQSCIRFVNCFSSLQPAVFAVTGIVMIQNLFP